MIIDEEEYLAHYGILRKSGRYPWGSGENPLQRSKTFIDILNKHMKEDGMSESDVAKFYTEIGEGTEKRPEFPFTVNDVRAIKSRAGANIKRDQIRTAHRLRESGMSPSAIARQMSTPEKTFNESTVRSLLEPGRLEKLSIHENIAEMLKRQVEEKGYIDVGAEVERSLPIGDDPTAHVKISRDKFMTAVSMLKEEGYSVHSASIKQVGTGEFTKHLILSKEPQTEAGRRAVYANRDNFRQITEKSEDGGRSFNNFGIKPPLHIDPKRVGINYKEDGGSDADGVIYVRPGVKDLNMGNAHYAQVRIAVGGTHYIKGMAVYKDDLPKGVDLVFNTNKARDALGPNKLDALKKLKLDENGEIDKDNPFGAVIKMGGQILDKNDNVTSVMNLVNEEGDWDKWSRNLAPQMLSKQRPQLAERQLALTLERRQKEFEEIKGLINPQIRRKLLESFSDDTDSAAVHLKAAAMPDQSTKVLLPSTKVSPREIFAPTYENGTRVALVRFPHAGRFEIPELIVNNKNPAARELMGVDDGKSTARDAVVIHPKVAERLSGADFDGDTVVVIPNSRKEVLSKGALDELKGFDPQAQYKPYDGMRTIDGGTYNAKTKEVEYGTKADGTPIPPKTTTKGNEMGNVTNLISDMTIRGAPDHEVARAVKHSMVVIDAEKHNLDYKASYHDQNIRQLKEKYQGLSPEGKPRGASTLITRASSQKHINARKNAPASDDVTLLSVGTVDNKTGKKVYVETGEGRVQYKDADGRTVSKRFESREEADAFVRETPGAVFKPKTFRTKYLAVEDDAFQLVSDLGGTDMERVYARHSNKMKALANEARLEAVRTTPIPYSSTMRKVYAEEVASLDAKLNIALKNAPRERQAQVLANAVVEQRKRANPELDGAELKRIKGQALTGMRIRTDASKSRIGADNDESRITEREWQAIQAGAISRSKMDKILANADIDAIKKLATPKPNYVMTDVATARARQLRSSGKTLAEISAILGIPQSTIQSGLD